MSSSILTPFKSKLLWLFVGICLILALTPFWLLLYFGQDSHVLIHDHLDGAAIWPKLLVDSQMLFADMNSIIQAPMGGVPRSFAPGEFSIYVALYAVFSPFNAVMVNDLMMRLGAFLGMLLLLRTHVLGRSFSATIIAAGCGAAFAALPFWPPGGLSVAGQPLLLWAFLSIRSGTDRWWHWVIVPIFALYSDFATIGLFVGCVLGLWWLRDVLLARKSMHIGRSFAALALLGVFYVLQSYRLFLSLISSDGPISHRVEMTGGSGSLIEALPIGWRMFTSGQYHAASLHEPVILPVLAAVAILMLARHMRRKLPDAEMMRLVKILAGSFVFIALTSAFYGLWQSEMVGAFFAETKAPYVNFARFHWLHPFIWYLAFGCGLMLVVKVAETLKYKQSIAPVVKIAVALICVFVTFSNIYNGDFVRSALRQDPSWRAFFAEAQFAEIAQAIGEDKSSYRVLSIGLHPSVSLYNGFHTLDGYASSYPLAWKHAFREVIAPQLAKMPDSGKSYDRWGSRAYVFNSMECGYLCISQRAPANVSIALDMDAFTKLGGTHIIAATELANADALGLTNRGTFTHPDSAWTIHLYQATAAQLP